MDGQCNASLSFSEAFAGHDNLLSIVVAILKINKVSANSTVFAFIIGIFENPKFYSKEDEMISRFIRIFSVVIGFAAVLYATDFKIEDISTPGISFTGSNLSLSKGQVAYAGKAADGNVYLYLDKRPGIVPISGKLDDISLLQLENGKAAWTIRYGEIGAIIYFYDGNTTNEISLGYTVFNGMCLNNGKLVWSIGAYHSPFSSVFLYDGKQGIKISNDDNNTNPNAFNDEITWTGGSNQVFYYKNNSFQQVTNFSNSCYFPKICNGQITFLLDNYATYSNQVMLYKNGTTSQLSTIPTGRYANTPQICEGQVVWMQYNGIGNDIYFYNGVNVMQLTDNGDNYNVHFKDGQIAWFQRQQTTNRVQVMAYCNGEVLQLTNDSSSKTALSTDNGQIAWNADDKVFLASPQYGFDPLARYKIVNRNSGKVLDVAEYSMVNGGNIHQWDYVGGLNQQWNIIPTAQSFKIQNVLSGKVADVADFSISNGGTIHQWDYVDGLNQQWNIIPVRPNLFKIENCNSKKVMDVECLSTANGANVHQWDYVSGLNQQWSIEKLPFEFKWICEDANKDGAWNYSYSNAGNSSYNFLTANSWGNIQITTEKAYEGTASLKFYLNHVAAGYATASLPTNVRGDGSEPKDNSEATLGKDLSKAKYLRFCIQGSTTTRFFISLVTQSGSATPEVILGNYSQTIGWSWQEVKIPMADLYSAAIDFSKISIVKIRMGAEQPLGQVVFFVDNLRFTE